MCNKAVKLWSEFEFNEMLGQPKAEPTELEEPGNRSKYVTEFSYVAREAGYSGGIVTRLSGDDDEPFIEYPEPLFYCNDNFKPFTLTPIPWNNFPIIGKPVWTGRAKRFFKDKKATRWCRAHNRRHHPIFNLNFGLLRNLTTKHEYAVYQNENVQKHSN